MSRIVRLVHLGWGLKKVGSFPSFSLCFGYANWKNQMEKGLDLPHCAKRNLYGNSLTTNPNREVPPNIRKNNRYVSDLNPRGDPKQQRTFAKSAAQSNTVTHDHTTDRSVFWPKWWLYPSISLFIIFVHGPTYINLWNIHHRIFSISGSQTHITTMYQTIFVFLRRLGHPPMEVVDSPWFAAERAQQFLM